MFKFYLPFYEKSNINNYKEFDLKLDPREKVPIEKGIGMKHQDIISNLMRGVTPVESLLLVHDMGTGKSCTAIQAIEKNIRDNMYGMKKAIILNRGKAIMNNFINELVNKCTVNYNLGTEKTQKALWSKFYTFDTFELFAKRMMKLSDENIKEQYNNTFLVIDEIHNILNDESNVYYEISRFISLVPNKRVLLLTGTPVRDSPEDIVPILNLILTEKIDKNTFLDKYYDADGNITNEFKVKIFDKVSYLKSSIPEIDIQYKGSKILDLKKFKVVTHKMSSFQNAVYKKAFQRDSDSGGVYTYSRQACRFVFPDGTYGSEGYNNWVIDKKRRFKNMKQELHKYGTDLESVLKRIEELSVKYAYIIRSILEADKMGEKSIVYDDLVKGSGLILFSMLLDFIGFKKYRLISSETTSTTEISKIQKIFNDDIRGENISVILGSRVIAEGFTFLDVIHEHLVPHWNNTETMQVVARGIRMGSHTKILYENPDAVVYVYRHVVISDDPNKSIDYMMTKLSEKKDIEINKIIDVIKEVSITCNSFRRRNMGKCLSEEKQYSDDSNYISIGTLKPEILNNLIKYFSRKNFEHINILSKYLDIKVEELIKYLCHMVSEKIVFRNDIGVSCYLNNKRNFYFVTEDIRTEEDILMSEYSRDLKPYSKFSVTDIYNDAVDIEVNNLNSNKNKQRLIELALTVKLCDIPVKNIETVEDILSSFKNSWSLNKETGLAVVWYLSEFVEEKAQPRCLLNPISDKPWLEWGKCNKNIKAELIDKRFEKVNAFEQELKNKNINFYGLWNPTNNEFCIKKLVSNSENQDKRKIESGKRCENWEKSTLKDIAKKEMKMIRDWDQWNALSRKNMCVDMKTWFDENKLLLENKSCGVQTKRK